jgi:hypothetical protein
VAASLLAGLLITGCASAPPLSAMPSSDAAGELSVSGLLLLPGRTATVRYSPGSLDRAARVQERLELLAADWTKWCKRDIALGAYVLDRDEWGRAGITQTYGLPLRLGSTWMVVPGEGDDRTVTLWEGLVGGGLPAAEGMPMRGTPAEASSLGMADLLAQHQLAVGFVEMTGLTNGSVWLRDLLAHVVAGASFLRWEPARIGEVDALYQRAAAATPAPPLGATAVPEQPVGPWLAAQARLYGAAQVVLAKDGDDAVKHLIKMRKKKGAPLELADLEARYRGLAEALGH